MEKTSSASPSVSVVIVNYNGETYLPKTLAAVSQLGPLVEGVLLVDNASTDASLDIARRALPSVEVVALGRNTGPGPARNVGIARAWHDRVFVIDNDVAPAPGTVELLDQALSEHPAAALAMPAIVYASEPERVQFVGGDAHFLGTVSPRNAELPVEQLETAPSRTTSLISAAFLVDRTRLPEGPVFDESFFVYQEDHEAGLRLFLSGCDLLASPEAKCLHGEGTIGLSIRQTGRFTPNRIRYSIRNRWLVLLQLYQWRTLVRFAPALAAFELLQLLGCVRRQWLGHWLWAFGSGLRRLPTSLAKRRAFRRCRRRPDLDALRGGPFPFNAAAHPGGLERFVIGAFHGIARLNWRLGGGSDEA